MTPEQLQDVKRAAMGMGEQTRSFILLVTNHDGSNRIMYQGAFIDLELLSGLAQRKVLLENLANEGAIQLTKK